MTKHKSSLTMLDGVQLGLNLDLETSELTTCRSILNAAGANAVDTRTVELTVNGKRGRVMLSLRQHLHDRQRYFLNLSGNPLTFYTGQNVVGFAENCMLMIQQLYRRTLAIVERQSRWKFPARLYNAIDSAELNINYIEFATYSTVVPDVTQLLADTHHMYSSAYSLTDNALSVAELLNVRHERQHITHTSIALKLMGSDRRGIDRMLLAYDKVAEQGSKQSPHTALIANRLRIELSLQSEWFRRKKIGGKKLQTLAQLDAYVKLKHKTWTAFIDYEFALAVERSHLFSMWSIDRASSRAGAALAYQRQILNADDDARHSNNIVFDGKRAALWAQTRLLTYSESLQLMEDANGNTSDCDDKET